MIYDGVLTYTVITELKKLIIGARVERIVMPTALTTDIYLYYSKKSILKIDCTPSSAKMYLSNEKRGGPLTPPSFCMVLRKHLEGSRITNISQYSLDRVIQIDFETYNELKDKQTKTLVIELMGKHSNCILINNENVIIDSLKRITPSISSVRSVLPGLKYVYPITKTDFLHTNLESFLSNLDKEMTLMQYLTSTYNGFSKKFAQQIADMINIDANTLIKDLDNNILEKVFYTLQYIFECIDKNNISIDNENQYLTFLENDIQFSINSYLDKYYTNLNSINILKQEKENLSRQLFSNIKRLEKKLKTVLNNLQECDKMDMYRTYGELISANLYKLKEKVSEIVVDNFYNNNSEITIALNKELTPQQNAQKYFKKYSKLKATYTYSIEQKELLESEIEYLESVIYAIESVDNLSELSYIKDELILQKYIKNTQKEKKNKTKENKDNTFKDNILKMEYMGYIIYVGKNNMQNEYITHKIAKNGDIWLHVQKAPGSHIVIKNIAGNEIADNIIVYAATLAASNSKLKNDSKVNVDYCDVKYVKKHPSNKPGLVIYTNFSTITVKPI